MMDVDQVPLQQSSSGMQGVLSEVTNASQPYMEKIYLDNQAVVLEGLGEIRDLVIGHNKQKSNFIVLGIISRLVYLIDQPGTTMAIKTLSAEILGSLAQGIKENITRLLDNNTLQCMFTGLNQQEDPTLEGSLQFYETCIRCIRSIVISGSAYAQEKVVKMLPDVMERILKLIDVSFCTQECTCEIITACCKTAGHQEMFQDFRTLEYLTHLLFSGRDQVKAKATQALTALSYENIKVCTTLLALPAKDVFPGDRNNVMIVDQLSLMMSRCQKSQVQLHAACCFTNIYRTGILPTHFEHLISHKTLPCLVRMCDLGRRCSERVLGAQTLAYLIDSEPKLQRIAYVCDLLPEKLHQFLRPPAIHSAISAFIAASTDNLMVVKQLQEDALGKDELKTSAFLAYAALLSNEEDMRKSVADDNLVSQLATALGNNSEEVRVASIKCLLSLSRSVHVLRTFFQNQEIWIPVLELSKRANCSERETAALCALIANLLLEFSPCKEQLIAGGILERMLEWCKHTKSLDVIRNYLYALTNVLFRANTPEETDENKYEDRLEILEKIGVEKMRELVGFDDEVITIKILDIMCNVLTPVETVDVVMTKYADAFFNILYIALKMENSDRESMNGNSSDDDSTVDASNVVSVNIMCAVLHVIRNMIEGDPENIVGLHLRSDPALLEKIIAFAKSDDPQAVLVSEAIRCLCGLVLHGYEDDNRIEFLQKYDVKKVLQDFQGKAHSYLHENLTRALEYFV